MSGNRFILIYSESIWSITPGIQGSTWLLACYLDEDACQKTVIILLYHINTLGRSSPSWRGIIYMTWLVDCYLDEGACGGIEALKLALQVLA